MSARAVLLPVVALLAALALIGAHLASGGDDFVPTAAADPCRTPPLPAVTQELQTLSEALVVDGVRAAACSLGVTRERLVLTLPSERDRRALQRETGADDAALAAALRLGLQRSIGRLERGGRLPRASELRDDYAGDLGLPGLAEGAVRRIPDAVVDDLLPTADVLRRALRDLDVLAILREIDEPDALERRLRAGIEDAAKAEAEARLIARIPGPLRDLLGLG